MSERIPEVTGKLPTWNYIALESPEYSEVAYIVKSRDIYAAAGDGRLESIVKRITGFTPSRILHDIGKYGPMVHIEFHPGHDEIMRRRSAWKRRVEEECRGMAS